MNGLQFADCDPGRGAVPPLQQDRHQEDHVFFAGTYYAGDHTIKGGIYAERNKIYNLFGRTEFGAYAFDSIADFASGDYYSYNLYQPAPGYTINDVAAQWTYRQYSPFIQDTWQVNDNLSLQYGVRVDIPDANKKPIYNPAFEQTFGYPNNNSLGFNNKVIEPRFSFNYTFDTERMTQLRGGVGLFQTFPPTVWMTNPYQNNGMTVSTYNSYDPSSAPFSPDPFNQNIPAGSPSSRRWTSIPSRRTSSCRPSGRPAWPWIASCLVGHDRIDRVPAHPGQERDLLSGAEHRSPRRARCRTAASSTGIPSDHRLGQQANAECRIRTSTRLDPAEQHQQGQDRQPDPVPVQAVLQRLVRQCRRSR